MTDRELLPVPDGAVWIYLPGDYFLKANDGKILAQVSSAGRVDLWVVGEAKYHGLENAKKAAIAGIYAAQIGKAMKEGEEG